MSSGLYYFLNFLITSTVSIMNYGLRYICHNITFNEKHQSLTTYKEAIAYKLSIC